MRIVVLGGAGAMAQVIDRELAASGDVDAVVVADLDGDRADEAVRAIDTPGADKLEPAAVDVTDADALTGVLKGADAAVNATWYKLNVDVMTTCIDAGVPYVDLGGLFEVTLEQLELDERARDAGVTCLVGMGSTPGTMNVMAAHAAARLKEAGATAEAVRLRSASVDLELPDAEGFVAPYSIRTLLDEFTLDVPVVRDGELTRVEAMSGRPAFTMPDPVGEVEGLLTIHSELATLPRTVFGGVREMDFAVAFDPAFTETLATLKRLGLASRDPVTFDGREIVPYAFVAHVLSQLPTPDGEALEVDIQRVEADGTTADGDPVTVAVDCTSRPRKDWGVGGGTVGTGTPPAVAARWLADGRIDHPGVVPPEVAVDPTPFFEALGAGDRTIEVFEETGAGDRTRLSGGA